MLAIPVASFSFRLFEDSQKLAFSAEGVVGGLEESRSETALLDSLSLVDSPSLQDGFGGFVLLDGSSALDPANPLSTILPTREGLMIYSVQEGDTLSEIAAKFDISIEAILWANSGLRPSLVKPGQEIIILPVEGVLHEVKEGETLDSIAGLYGTGSEEIKKFNPKFQEILQTPNNRLIIPYGRPLKKSSYVSRWTNDFLDLGNYFAVPTTGWNWGRLHEYNAVDIANRCETPIYASAEGLVVERRSNGWNNGYGYYLKIEHPNKTYTLYAHLDNILVEEGRYILQGEPIALMGNTGKTHGPTGCHLHFEVRGAKNPFAKY